MGADLLKKTILLLPLIDINLSTKIVDVLMSNSYSHQILHILFIVMFKILFHRPLCSCSTSAHTPFQRGDRL